MAESDLLAARIEDAVRLCSERMIPKFVGFIDVGGAALAQKTAERLHASFMLYGGYPEAERVFFGAFPEWAEPEESSFPIVRLLIENRSDTPFTHRDVLGTFMSCGIERDTVGDILVGKEKTVAFVEKSVASHIIGQIDKIRNCGVIIKEDAGDFLPETSGFETLRGTVASARLDGVIAEIVRTSRSKAAELIEGGFVAVNGRVQEKCTSGVNSGDKIAVRGTGKFVIDDITGHTSKGRLVLNYRKFL